MSATQSECLPGEATLSDIERGYVEQGYRLPEGYTWGIVHRMRERYGTPDFMVPVVVVPGKVAGWGVPWMNGKPMRRPQ